MGYRIHHVLLLNLPESDACSSLSSSSRSTSSMDVSLSIFWWLALNDQVNIWNIKSSGSNISGNEYTEFVLFESSESNFSLILSNISVHNFYLTSNFLGEQETVGLNFGGAKDDTLSKSSVNNKHIGKGLHSVVVRAADRDMVDILLCFSFEIFCEIDDFPSWVEIVTSQTGDPRRNGSWKQHELCWRFAVLFDGLKKCINILFEAHIEHGVGFVENEGLKTSEVQVASVHVVKDSTCRADQDINAFS